MNIQDDKVLLTLIRQGLVNGGDLPPESPEEIDTYLADMQKRGESYEISREEAKELVTKSLQRLSKDNIVPFPKNVTSCNSMDVEPLLAAARNGNGLPKETAEKMKKNMLNARKQNNT